MKTGWQKLATAMMVALAYFPLFLHLDSPPIKLWDESLFAMRAYYMAEEGAYLPDFSLFPGITPFANIKPPMGTAIQALFLRLLGYNELALRLPSALFGIGVIVVLWIGIKKVAKDFWPGFAAACVLISSAGFVRMHGTRTGDQDVFLAFWMLSGLLAYFQAAETQKARWIWLTAFCFLCGFLTKSIAAFFFFPGMLAHALLHRRLTPLLKRPAFYAAAALLIGGIAAYYAVMESYLPGFWERASADVFGRFGQEVNRQGQPFHYYFTQFWKAGYFPWLWLLPLALLDRSGTPKQQRFKRLLWFALVSHLAIISSSTTKLSWYSLPVYPLLAGLLAMAFIRFARHSNRVVGSAAIAIGAAAFLFAYAQIVGWAMGYRIETPKEKAALIMEKLRRERPDIKSYLLYTQPFNGQTAYYTQLYKEQYGYDLRLKTYWVDSLLQSGDLVLACLPEKVERTHREYETKLIMAYEECQLLRLLEKKK